VAEWRVWADVKQSSLSGPSNWFLDDHILSKKVELKVSRTTLQAQVYYGSSQFGKTPASTPAVLKLTMSVRVISSATRAASRGAMTATGIRDIAFSRALSFRRLLFPVRPAFLYDSLMHADLQ
jgi:hypothetical protein